MKKFLKFLGIALVWLIIAAIVVGAALALGLPLASAMVVLAGLFVAWLIFLVVKKLIARRQAKRRAENLVNVEQPDDAGERPSMLQRLFHWGPRTSLERRFKRLSKLLSASRLREQGDPQYVLPWYLLLGEEGTGKSELLANANLSQPTIDDAALRTDEDSLDWWLYNEAIVLDTPGGYVGAAEDAPPHPEWSTLIRMLAERRSREPLNGIVVTVSYEQLEGDPDRLFDYGRRLRKRIDELMRGTKLHLPVYVVVTKCDQVSGFTAWCGNLASETLRRPLGLLNGKTSADGDAAKSFAREVVAAVSDRIGRLMLVLFNQTRPDPDLLCLPRNVDRLSDPLAAFSDGLFHATTFEESPRFQGVYVTGRQRDEEGAPQAFARDFFTRVLPGNRRVHSTLSGAERAEQQTRRLIQSGWGVAVIALLAILVTAWSSHKAYLTELPDKHAGEFGHAEAMSERIDRMHQLRGMVRGVRVETASWLTPWFGIPRISEPEFLGDLRRTYYERSRGEVIGPLDARFAEALSSREEAIAANELPDDELAFFISSLIERVNILSAYVDGIRDEELYEYPGPYDNSGVYFDETVDPLTIERANGIYKQTLIWSPEPSEARDELSRVRDQLVALLDATGQRMSWLIPWANDRLEGQGYRLADFWEGSGQLDDPPAVGAAFTIAGYDAIQYFLDEVELSGIDAARFQELRENFDAYYRERYIEAWEQFARNFDRGKETLIGHDDWYQAVNLMGTDLNPHFQLLQVMYQNMTIYEREELPEWAQLVRFYDEMRSFQPGGDNQDYSARNRVLTKLGLSFIKKTGPVGKAIAKQGKSGLKTRKKLDRASSQSGSSPDERALRLEEAGQILSQYRDSLTEIAFNSDIRSASYEATRGLFNNPDNPGKGEGPKAQAHTKMRELRAITGAVTQYNDLFWEVFTGPLEVVTEFHTQETACYVQERWETQFLVQLAGVPEERLPDYVFGEGRQLWTFMDQELSSFVERRPGAGYVPTSANGHLLPLREDFLRFATKGREQANGPSGTHSVRIQARPTGANSGAVFKPSRTSVELQCEGGNQSLENFNYPVSAVFNWDARCSNTVMEIDIGRHTLVKRWEGDNAFGEFLRDFRGGQQRYTPADFPRRQNILEDYGVEELTVGFQLSGHRPVIQRLEGMPSEPPDEIARCWS